MTTELPQKQLIRLREYLIKHFDEGELKTLCFDLDIDYEGLPGDGKAGRARELVNHCKRHGRLLDLIELCQEQRPYVAWPVKLWRNDRQEVATSVATEKSPEPQKPHSEEDNHSPPIQPPQTTAAEPEITLSEDGRLLTDENELDSPLPAFDTSFWENLAAPAGPVRLRDKLYIERDADRQLKHHIMRPGSITTIRAPRQTGKTSLLVRAVNQGRQHGSKIVRLNLQRIDQEQLQDLNTFLRYIAEFMMRTLRLNPQGMEKMWQGSLGTQDKLTYLMEDYVFAEIDTPIIFTIDEADRLLDTTFNTHFFGLLRAWNDNTFYDEQWEKLRMVLVISTEPYLLIADVAQSPFNVGLMLDLADFTQAQVRDLNQRHNLPVSTKDLPELWDLLSGHPYLTRQALYTQVTERLTWTEFMRVAPTDSGPFRDHLHHQLSFLYKDPSLRAALKEIMKNRYCLDEMAGIRLLRAGLIKGSGHDYRCRCDLYQQYFENHL